MLVEHIITHNELILVLSRGDGGGAGTHAGLMDWMVKLFSLK